MNSDFNNFYKPRISKFNHFSIMCPSCYLRMNVVISYDKENNCYNPKTLNCKICTKLIPIVVFNAVSKQ